MTREFLRRAHQFDTGQALGFCLLCIVGGLVVSIIFSRASDLVAFPILAWEAVDVVILQQRTTSNLMIVGTPK